MSFNSKIELYNFTLQTRSTRPLSLLGGKRRLFIRGFELMSFCHILPELMTISEAGDKSKRSKCSRQSHCSGSCP